jgi:branched-chain amino acid transport system permease protein
MKKKIHIFCLGVILIILFTVPSLFDLFMIDTFIYFGITALFAVSLNLLAHCGLYSLGHALFFGIGAYVTALGLLHIDGLPLWSALLLGGLVSGLFGLIVSPLLVRVSGVYFTLLTIALNQIMYAICLKFYEVTSGENGIAGYPIPPLNIPGIGSYDMGNKTYFYYFAVLVIVISVWVMWFVTKTPLGGIMLGIRDNQERVTYLGFRVPVAKTIIFIISGFFAGIAGSFFALWLNVVDPFSTLHLVHVSILTFLAILVGGLGTFIGPFFGVGILVMFDHIIFTYGQTANMVIGLVTVVYLLYAPRYTPWGIMGIYERIKHFGSGRRTYDHRVVQ